MAKQYRARAFPIPEVASWLALVLFLLLGSALALAETGLKPYTAQYTTEAKGFTLKLTRELKQNADGEYVLTNGGKKLVVGFQEEARFRVEGTQIIPSSYVYQGTGLINRRREVHFTPGSDKIRSLYKDQWYNLPYTEGTLDRMSQQEQLRLILVNDPTPKEDITIRYDVADGDNLAPVNSFSPGREFGISLQAKF